MYCGRRNVFWDRLAEGLLYGGGSFLFELHFSVAKTSPLPLKDPTYFVILPEPVIQPAFLPWLGPVDILPSIQNCPKTLEILGNFSSLSV